MLKNTTYDIYSASGRSTFSQGLVADAAFQTEYIISTILFYTNIKIYTDGWHETNICDWVSSSDRDLKSLALNIVK